MNPKVAIISLVHNRPDYVKRSFDSLYARAGIPFDLYVYDDGSNKETLDVLKKLQSKYNFKLFKSKKRENISVKFSKAVLDIPMDYDYYVKFDSDIEILSDNLFLQILECFYPGIYGITPRIEGVFSYEKYPEDVEFYNGHVIRSKISIAFGCCMVVKKEVIEKFKEVAKKMISEKDVKWGIDTKLYECAGELGKYIKVEDLSVYHIDNNYGQRKDFDYFIERKRWKRLDDEEVYFIKASKILNDVRLCRDVYYNILNISVNFDDFVNKLKMYSNKEEKTTFGYSLVRNKYGKVFPIKNEQLEEILSMEGMELLEQNTTGT